LKEKTNITYNQTDDFPIAIRFYEEGKIPAAEKTLNEIIRKNPYDTDALLFLGGIYLNEGSYDKAERCYKKIISLAKDHPTANYNIACVLHKLDRLYEAEEYYKKTLLINPNHIDALHNLGDLYSALGKNEDALNYYNEVIKLNSGRSKTLVNIAKLLSSRGEYDKAEYYYAQAIFFDPLNIQYVLNLAECFVKQDRYDKAINNLEMIIKEQPDCREAVKLLGEVYLLKGDSVKANECFERESKLNPSL
jgi:tetratricopeptide (TPR) repeat protein